MKKRLLILLLLFFAISASAAESQFEELDKPPEGAHEGQMLLGGFVSIGLPSGDLIDGEEKFVKDNTYTFPESDITKEFMVTHLSYDFGLSFEYMPIDYIGIKTRLKRSIIVQRTRFGSDFKNWSETLYSNYSFLIGPAFHLTNRKQWDVTFTPVAGYAAAKYRATPIAAELLSSTEYNNSGNRNRDVNGMTYGAELNLTIYFSGGLYISIGADWNKYPLTFSPGFDLSQSSGKTYLDGKSSGSIQTMNLAISAGYAFSN
jgi:hypothetical protein